MASQYKSEKVGKFGEQNGLILLQMVQFECPRNSNPLVSSNFGVGRMRLPQEVQIFTLLIEKKLLGGFMSRRSRK